MAALRIYRTTINAGQYEITSRRLCVCLWSSCVRDRLLTKLDSLASARDSREAPMTPTRAATDWATELKSQFQSTVPPDDRTWPEGDLTLGAQPASRALSIVRQASASRFTRLFDVSRRDGRG